MKTQAESFITVSPNWYNTDLIVQFSKGMLNKEGILNLNRVEAEKLIILLEDKIKYLKS